MNITQDVRDYVRHFVDETGVDGIDIFCCDKTRGAGEIFEVYGYGIGQELKHGYRAARLFEVDPFTDVMLREEVIDASDSFEMASDPRLSSIGNRSARYWRFMAEREIEIVGASTRRYLPGFYLVVGLHQVKTNLRRGELSYDQLNHELQTIKDMVSVNILSLLLRAGDGYGQLRRSLSDGPSADLHPLSALSPRESEIAKLICLGKQNKQIAYVTGLSVHTVENHLKRIYRKLSIQNRAALVSKVGERMH